MNPTLPLLALALAASPLIAQANMGTVPLDDANVTISGQPVVGSAGGRAALTGSSFVQAKSTRTAQITLARGGVARVCQGSSLHVMQGSDGSLLLAVDRGATEIHMKLLPNDLVITPDLRFAMPSGGELDLRLHVTQNGDTCVENRGRKSPVLDITDTFGDTTYQLKPGQHVLFEHGSLRDVVDRETTPCGCAPDERPGVSIAEAALHGRPGPVTPKQSEAAHPFPTAISEGLAPPTPAIPEAPNQTHVQVATSLNYDPAAPQPGASSPPALQAPLPDLTSNAANPPAPQPERGGFHAIGRFFKRLFVR